MTLHQGTHPPTHAPGLRRRDRPAWILIVSGIPATRDHGEAITAQHQQWLCDLAPESQVWGDANPESFLDRRAGSCREGRMGGDAF